MGCGATCGKLYCELSAFRGPKVLAETVSIDRIKCLFVRLRTCNTCSAQRRGIDCFSAVALVEPLQLAQVYSRQPVFR